RMPVMDGLQMAQAIREINPEIRIIATTAHSDTSYLLEAIEIGIDHYVLKPVDINRLISSIEKCIGDINAQKELKRYHQGREKLLSLKTQELGETVIALKVLIQNNEAEREILELTMVDNLSLLIEPTLEKLKKSSLNNMQRTCVEILTLNLQQIMSPLLQKTDFHYRQFTPSEIQIVNLIKNGKTTQEIAEFLHLSVMTIATHRKNIRKKVGLTKKKQNLQSFLG
ncbi:MAG: response regulator, partial [Pseudomonadota bacterium]